MREQRESPGQCTSRSKNFRPLTDHHDASVDTSWEAVPNQAGDELSCRRTVVSADPGRQRGHGGVVQVERAAVGGVWVQGA